MSNAQQKEYWNGEAGNNWALGAETLDSMLHPFLALVLEASGITSGDRVLDVGCGSGALSLAAIDAGARHVTGVDISAPMLSVAHSRAQSQPAPPEFLETDASTWTAETPFDRVISRFGVMFFDDPVAAFSNLHRQTEPQGTLAFSCWQAAPLNEWAMAPMKAVLPLLSEPPTPPEPGAPGPFAFADPDRTRSILADAGWTKVSVTPLDRRDAAARRRRQ